MPKRSADKSTVKGHLGNSRVQIGAMFALVVRNPRRQKLLGAREDTRGQHLGAHRVRLQLLEV